jgi:hypothetical protein
VHGGDDLVTRSLVDAEQREHEARAAEEGIDMANRGICRGRKAKHWKTSNCRGEAPG